MNIDGKSSVRVVRHGSLQSGRSALRCDECPGKSCRQENLHCHAFYGIVLKGEAALDDKDSEKLRDFIFESRPQPFSATAVYEDMNGELEGGKRKTFLEAKPKRATDVGTCWNGGVMVSMKKMMLGAALAVGAATMTAAPAQAAVRFGVAIGGPVAYVPPSPGPGYVWVNGYWANGVWVPGYWNAPAVGFGVRIGGPVYHGPYYRGYDHFRGPDRFRR